MRPALLRTATLLLLLAAASCGQKGALYLPDKTRMTVPAADSTAPAAAPAPAQPPASTPAAPSAQPAPTQPAPATPSGSSGS